MMKKRKIRRQLLETLQRLGHAELGQKSAHACERLCRTDEFQRAQVVMFFLSLEKEIDTTEAIQQALSRGKTVAVPAIIWDERRLQPVRISSLDCRMHHDRHNLRWPIDTERLAPEKVELIVVSGLGFDVRGNRLGRGGGYYDRFLGDGQDGLSGVSCGLAFENQLIDSMPVTEHDVPLDMLVTDECVRKFDRTDARPKTGEAK